MSTAPQAAPERRETEAPVGTVHVFDPHPLESVEVILCTSNPATIATGASSKAPQLRIRASLSRR